MQTDNTSKRAVILGTILILAIFTIGILRFHTVNGSVLILFGLGSFISQNPKFKSREADYGIPWPKATMELNLWAEVNDVSTEFQIVSDDVVYSHKEPPDMKFTLAFPTLTKILEGNWSRSGSYFLSSSDTMDNEADAVDGLEFRVEIQDPFSIPDVGVVNPYPWVTRFRATGLEDDQTTEISDIMEVYIPPMATVELSTAMLVEDIKVEGGEFLKMSHYIYDENLPNNYLKTYHSADGAGSHGFYLPFASVNPKTGVSYGPTILTNGYNFIDRYDLLLAVLGGVVAGTTSAYSAVENSPLVTQVASALKVPAAVVAAIFWKGLDNGWLKVTDLYEKIIPAILGVTTPAMASFIASRMTSKYTGLLGSAGAAGIAAGVTTGGAARILLSMIDDIESVLEV
jgi:hypothetical protein